MIAIIGTSDRPCWLAEACKILLLLLLLLASLTAPAFGVSAPSWISLAQRSSSTISVLGTENLLLAQSRQSAIWRQNQSEGAKGKLWRITGSAMRCVLLCKWLHWKQRFADSTGSIPARGKLVRAASFCDLLCKQLLLAACLCAEIWKTADLFCHRLSPAQGIASYVECTAAVFRVNCLPCPSVLLCQTS